MLMKISIVIPAYNEEKRIKKTIRAYHQFFLNKQENSELSFELVIALNGCKDQTLAIVERIREQLAKNTIVIIDMQEAGKGLAIKQGFANALTRNNDLIGFVDADMATAPEAFYELAQVLLTQNPGAPKEAKIDGVIASRYMPGAQITPARPAYKRYGSRIIYEPFVWLFFGLSYYDLQCGAKLFKRSVLEKITPQLTVTQWAFDVELLYLCKKAGYTIKEIPTIWHDQADSKLTLRGGLRMFSALFKVWWQHHFSKK